MDSILFKVLLLIGEIAALIFAKKIVPPNRLKLFRIAMVFIIAINIFRISSMALNKLQAVITNSGIAVAENLEKKTLAYPTEAINRSWTKACTSYFIKELEKEVDITPGLSHEVMSRFICTCMADNLKAEPWFSKIEEQVGDATNLDINYKAIDSISKENMWAHNLSYCTKLISDSATPK